MKSMAGLATKLTERIAQLGSVVIAVDGDHHAETLARLLRQLTPRLPVVWFPTWDCLPYDKAGPSAGISGARMRVLYDLSRFPGEAVVVTTAEALVQRVPAASALPKPLRLKVGAPFDREAFTQGCVRFGYVHDDRIDDPGEFAIRGEVVDIYPPHVRPYRIGLEGDRIASIHTFDPVSQRSVAEIEGLRIDPVSEVLVEAASERFTGIEHWLPDHCPSLTTLIEGYSRGPIILSPDAEARLSGHFDSIGEAFQDRHASDKAANHPTRQALQPGALYVAADAWGALVDGRREPWPNLDALKEVPRFCLEDKPGHCFGADINQRRSSGQRIVLGGPREKDRSTLVRQVKRATGEAPRDLAAWADALALPPGAIGILPLSADRGFVDETADLCLITAADLIGHYARARHGRAAHVPWHFGDGEFTPGDVVVHLDHGVALLQGLETISVGHGPEQDGVRLRFADEADLIVPVGELGRVWRYGAAAGEVTLDRIDGKPWQKRRVSIAKDIEGTAQALVDAAEKRNASRAPSLVPDRRDYEQFVAGFRFSPTADQMHAIDDCLRDLASERPMDRLVVGDVGFGKTEVALRAAAAAVLAGRQVAVVAPTTVLVRQHFDQFSRRFAALGIEVAQLSRLVGDEDAERVRSGLADGFVRLVVGTHALTSDAIAFAELGLLIIDEEQRFGLAEKSALRALGSGVHVLTLTATPIPRTLQSAMVGLQDLSVMTTPPALRRPIKTQVTPFDAATLRTALLKEKARGGQSFIVVPRIGDLAPIAADLQALLPDLNILTGHGRMDAQAADEAMSAFAGGEGDVLLATSIIESGLDVPRANTMVVCGAERFGLAQLHQLRGRVGRGRHQGLCYLMTSADHANTIHTDRRLSTLARLDRLGSGLAISAQDLDSRGSGDLLGDDQAGHLHLIGLGLFQHLLQRAIRRLNGEQDDDWAPELHVGDAGRFDETYIPEPDVRLNLYARLARAADAHECDMLLEEVEDRFGPLPSEATALFTTARLRCLCHEHHVARLDAGPRGVALTPCLGLEPEGLVLSLDASRRAGARVKAGRLLVTKEEASRSDTTLDWTLHLLEPHL